MRSFLVLLLTIFSARSMIYPAIAAENEVSIGVDPLKWTVSRDKGSGFLDRLWFDENGDGTFSVDEQVIQPSEGKARIFARISIPPIGAWPIGVRANWKIFSANLKITDVRKLKAPALGTQVSGLLVYPGGEAEAQVKVTLNAVEGRALLLSDFEITWNKLPTGARLVEAGFELETCFEEDQIMVHMRPDSPGKWGRGRQDGTVVAPSKEISFMTSPTGGTAVHYLAWLQVGPQNGKRIAWTGVKGKAFHLPSNDTVGWCDLSDARRGVAVIAKDAESVVPKMFGSLGGNPRSLFFWTWPPTVDGLLLEVDKTYRCTGIAWHFHKGRSNMQPTEESGQEKDQHTGAIQVIDEMRKNLAPIRGNLVATLPPEHVRLSMPDTDWMDANVRDGLPLGDPQPQGTRIPILLSGGGRAGMADVPVPFRCGVPFPNGKLDAPESVRLLDTDGQEIPCQVERTASWPDGSVKWVLLDFLAPAPNGSTKVAGHLEWGEGIAHEAVPNLPVRVSRDEDVVTVDTGVIRFTAAKGACGFLRTVEFDLDGNGKYDESEHVIDAPVEGERRNHFVYVHRQDVAGYLSGFLDISGRLDPAEVQVESVEIEAAGPIRATLCIRGTYRHKHFEPIPREVLGTRGLVSDRFQEKEWMPPAAASGSQFAIWLTAWAGSRIVAVKHDFVFEGIGGYQYAVAIGLSLRPVMDLAQRRVIMQGIEPGKALSLKLGASQHLASVQEHRDLARVVKVSGVRSETIASGLAAPDRLSVSDDRWGLTVGLRDMWAMDPQALHVGGEDVMLYFWPPHVAPWDSRGPSGHASAFTGISRTHEAVLVFHRTAESLSALDDANRYVLRPAQAHASTGWTCSTYALGLCHPYDPELFPKTESLLQRHVESSRRRMLLSRSEGQPGITCYGSVDSTEAYAQYALALQAARTGFPDLYRMALAKCRFDAGMAYRKGVTRGHRPPFAANHPTDWAVSFYRALGDPGTRGGQLMYYLTGDESLRDFANLAARGFLDGSETLQDTKWSLGRAKLGHLLWAWERGGKGDYAAQVKSVFSAAKSGHVDTEKTSHQGHANAAVDLYTHCGEPSILELAKQKAAAAMDQSHRNEKRWTARVTWPALLFWKEGQQQATYLEIMKAHMQDPPTGGAFWHYTMYEFPHLFVNMAAQARHGLAEENGP